LIFIFLDEYEYNNGYFKESNMETSTLTSEYEHHELHGIKDLYLDDELTIPASSLEEEVIQKPDEKDISSEEVYHPHLSLGKYMSNNENPCIIDELMNLINIYGLKNGDPVMMRVAIIKNVLMQYVCSQTFIDHIVFFVKNSISSNLREQVKCMLDNDYKLRGSTEDVYLASSNEFKLLTAEIMAMIQEHAT